MFSAGVYLWVNAKSKRAPYWAYGDTQIQDFSPAVGLGGNLKEEIEKKYLQVFGFCLFVCRTHPVMFRTDSWLSAQEFLLQFSRHHRGCPRLNLERQMPSLLYYCSGPLEIFL